MGDCHCHWTRCCIWIECSNKNTRRCSLSYAPRHRQWNRRIKPGCKCNLWRFSPICLGCCSWLGHLCVLSRLRRYWIDTKMPLNYIICFSPHDFIWYFMILFYCRMDQWAFELGGLSTFIKTDICHLSGTHFYQPDHTQLCNIPHDVIQFPRRKWIIRYHHFWSEIG